MNNTELREWAKSAKETDIEYDDYLVGILADGVLRLLDEREKMRGMLERVNSVHQSHDFGEGLGDLKTELAKLLEEVKG